MLWVERLALCVSSIRRRILNRRVLGVEVGLLRHVSVFRSFISSDRHTVLPDAPLVGSKTSSRLGVFIDSATSLVTAPANASSSRFVSCATDLEVSESALFVLIIFRPFTLTLVDSSVSSIFSDATTCFLLVCSLSLSTTSSDIRG